MKTTQSELTIKRKLLNLCVRCGREKSQYAYRCPICQENDRIQAIRVRKKRKENNRCIRCGRPLIERTSVTKCINCMEGSVEFVW